MTKFGKSDAREIERNQRAEEKRLDKLEEIREQKAEDKREAKAEAVRVAAPAAKELAEKEAKELLDFWAKIASKIGKADYLRMVKILGDKIPLWDLLVASSLELQAKARYDRANY